MVGVLEQEEHLVGQLDDVAPAARESIGVVDLGRLQERLADRIDVSVLGQAEDRVRILGSQLFEMARE